jgi:hypothetical protein
MLGLLAGLMRADLTMTDGASRDGMHDAFNLGGVAISSRSRTRIGRVAHGRVERARS